jgi:hypothetical protein
LTGKLYEIEDERIMYNRGNVKIGTYYSHLPDCSLHRFSRITSGTALRSSGWIAAVERRPTARPALYRAWAGVALLRAEQRSLHQHALPLLRRQHALYRQLTAMQANSPRRLPISVISYEASESVKDALSKEHVNVNGVYRIRQLNGIYGTPTLFLVDANGIVRRVFEGRLEPAQEKELLQIVSAGTLRKG